MMKLFALTAYLFALSATEASLPSLPAPVQPTCNQGVLKQGGLLLCSGAPGTFVEMDGIRVAQFDENGKANIGLSRLAPTSVTITLQHGASRLTETLTIGPSTYQNSVFNVGNCDTVRPRTEAQQKKVETSWIKKRDAFAIFHSGEGFDNGALRPADQRMSSAFGKRRVYICTAPDTGEKNESERVHYGYDIATPIGTPIKAPADGVVILADPDLYFEGGAVFLDHGQGLVSVFIHLSKIDVAVGDVIKTGDVIAKSGNTGRTSGPHLHWAVKWRNTTTDDRSGDYYIDPQLLLEAL